jgi:hypothetical protein
MGCETAWVQAAKGGSGLPYTRGPEWSTPATTLNLPSIRGNILTGRDIGVDGETVTVDERGRVHYALGLLGVEDEMEELGLAEGQGGGDGSGKQ